MNYAAAFEAASDLLSWTLATLAIHCSLWLFSKLRLARKDWLGAPLAWFYAITIGLAVKFSIDSQIIFEAPFYISSTFLIVNIGLIFNLFVLFQNRGKMPVRWCDEEVREWIVENLEGKRMVIKDSFSKATVLVANFNLICQKSGVNEYYELKVTPSKRHAALLPDSRYPSLADVITHKWAIASVGDFFIIVGVFLGATSFLFDLLLPLLNPLN